MRSITVISMLAVAALAAADEVRLQDGGTLGGNVIAMDGDVLRLESPLSAQPVAIRTDRLRSVSFHQDVTEDKGYDSQVILTNQDQIPCEIRGITEDKVNVSTRYSGEFSIPRKAVSSIQLGTQPREEIYRGPQEANDWSTDGQWRWEGGRLVSGGMGFTAKVVETLPESFAIRFHLSWDPSEQPKLEFYFCSDTQQTGNGKFDRYHLQFSRAGFGLRRQSAEDGGSHRLGEVSRPLDSFEGAQTQVEVRVDRTFKRVLLYVDGKPEGRFTDPLSKSPGGNILLFLSNTQKEGALRIGEISIRAWNGGMEESADTADVRETDSLVDREGQRFSGGLLDTQEGDAGLVARFKSPIFTDVLQIPMTQVSSLFLARTEGSVSPPATFSIGTVGQGIMSAVSCQISDTGVIIEHPLIGKLTVDRDDILSLGRRPTEPPTEEP